MTDKQIQDEIRRLKAELLRRKQVRASEKYLAKQAGK